MAYHIVAPFGHVHNGGRVLEIHSGPKFAALLEVDSYPFREFCDSVAV